MSGLVNTSSSTGLSEIIPESLKIAGADRASVVLARSTATYYPTGSQTIRSDQNRTTTIRLASSEFIDPATAYLNFRALVHNPKTRHDDFINSLIDRVVVRVGGVEVENITDYGSMYRLLAMPSMPHQHYQHTASLQQGAWRYVQREGQRLTVSSARVLQDGTTATYLDDLGVVCVAYTAGGTSGMEPNIYLGSAITNGWGYSFTYNALWGQGNSSATDSAAVGDAKFSHGGSTIGRGSHFQIPLSELSGLMSTNKYLCLPLLGSVDLEITWAPYNKCMVESHVTVADRNGIHEDITNAAYVTAYGAAAAAVTNALRVYEVRDITVTVDTVAMDPTYSMFFQQLASQSQTGITIPFTSHVCQTKNFTPGGTQTLTYNKGVSFLKSVILGLRPSVLVNNPLRLKSDFYGADVFRSLQFELGGKSYPQNALTNTTATYQELMKAFNTHNNIHSGGLLSRDVYNGYKGSNNNILTIDTAVMDFGTGASIPPSTTVMDRLVPLTPKQQFIMGMNYERVLGQPNVLSGVSMKTSGYNLLVNLGLQTKSEVEAELLAFHNVGAPAAGDSAQVILEKKEKASEFKPSWRYFSAYDVECLAVMVIDKAITLRMDTVSVAD